MTIRFYNTLTRRVEPFQPIDPPEVFMYNCGLTVYDYGHIGNFRTFIFADVLRRFLELAGYRVHQVMNITDVGHMTEDQLADGGGEDKMRVGAQRLKQAKKQGKIAAGEVDNPSDPLQVADYFTKVFLEDARRLGMKIAEEYPQHVPRATEHVEKSMIPMIQSLLDQGHAYIAGDGAVYYSVESFPDYGRLSGNTLDELRGGAGGRVLTEHQAVKRHPADFLLWKPDATHLMKWPSPWGEGYPGWHIECSAMARAMLGRDVIDIHTGSEDNIFPHHECEIAQTRGATGRDAFARFWMHTRHLMVDGEKMSKSKGNFYTVRELVENRGVDPAALRFELLRAHYRSNMNFTFKGLEDSTSAVRRLRVFRRSLLEQARGNQGNTQVDASHPMLGVFIEALADDLNISGALGALFGWLRDDHKDPVEALAALEQANTVLGVSWDEPASATDESVEATCRAIDQARSHKDYDTADRLRTELRESGYEILNTPGGTVARRKIG